MDILVQELVEFRFHRIPIFTVNAITDAGPVHIALNQPHAAKLFQMLGNGGLCQPDLLHQVPADTGIYTEKVLQDGNARRVGKHLGDQGQFILLLGEYFGLGQSHYY